MTASFLTQTLKQISIGCVNTWNSAAEMVGSSMPQNSSSLAPRSNTWDLWSHQMESNLLMTSWTTSRHSLHHEISPMYAAGLVQQWKHLGIYFFSKVQWSPDLDTAFQSSKEKIVKQCVLGVQSFDPAWATVLATDWSKFAMGFWLCQKHCNCESSVPGCCNQGWKPLNVEVSLFTRRIKLCSYRRWGYIRYLGSWQM